ncbi:MAG: hypothetical protein M1374_06165 [Firmicutes bacterium]|nr:hypothetical protein [Bacillota bacterium]
MITYSSKKAKRNRAIATKQIELLKKEVGSTYHFNVGIAVAGLVATATKK